MPKNALCVAVAVLLLAAGEASALCTAYWSRTSKTSVAAVAFAAADFNGDGKPDLAGVTDASVLVALTTAAGQIGAPATVATGSGTFESIAAVDITGDGKADLLINDTTLNALHLFPGRGDGTFGAAVTTVTTIAPNELATGDFTGDQKLDVAFVNDAGSILTVWAGSGTGAFQEAGRITTAGVLVSFAAGDFTGDGKLDLFAQVGSTKIVRLYTGNGDGTFAASAEYGTFYPPNRIATADVDADGDLDIVALPQTARIVVFLNGGTGNFGPYATYFISRSSSLSPPTAVSLSDVNGDAIIDVVVALEGSRIVATLPGSRNGTFGTASAAEEPEAPSFVHAADITGDGRNDLILAARRTAFATTAVNTCGDTQIRALLTPLVSVGSPVSGDVYLNPDTGSGHLWPTPVRATGTITPRTGATSHGTLDVSYPTAVSLHGLAVGSHVVEIDYSGDERYRPRTSAPVTVRVTNETTTTRVIPDQTTAAIEETVYLKLEVTASDGGEPTGKTTLFRNGVAIGIADRTFAVSEDELGTYTYQARYEGSESHPPSGLSAPAEVTFTKKETTLRVSGAWAISREGETRTLTYAVDPAATGHVSLSMGATHIATKALSSSQVSFDLNLLQGTHRVTARYLGDARHFPSEVTNELAVVPHGMLGLDVSARHGKVQVTWASTVPVVSVALFRSTGNLWTKVHSEAFAESLTYTVPDPVPGTVYIYRAESYDHQRALIARSNVDAALFTTFSDDPLLPGITKVKVAHVTELVAAINAYRAAFGVAAMLPIANASRGNLFLTSDLMSLRYALNDARAAIGAAPLSYRIVTAKQSLIRAHDLEQLRDGLR